MRTPLSIAGHVVNFDSNGQLLPWTSWTAALDRQMNFYQQCPLDRGYPRFACETFLDGSWTPSTERTDIIPSTQNGMGIISYLKFHALHGEQQPAWLATARLMGNYLLKEVLTPEIGKYPAFTRSTGKRAHFPQPADCGSQSDRPYEIQPDKGGIAGYALAALFAATGESGYLAQALQNARVLVANQQAGDAQCSPWPFRVDYRNGEGRGPVSGNMVYILRLYDLLMEHGYAEFAEPRHSLWRWIKDYQLPSAAAGGALFAQFFEDHDTPTNRTAWAPLNLARYLLEMRERIDADWQLSCGLLIDFVRNNFTHQEMGITVCHEQDEDKQAWGGVNSTYGAVLAMYAKPMESANLAREARQVLDFTLYSTDEQGRPRDLFSNQQPGGWQEDAHTDVIHNFVDALSAFPQWAESDGGF
jgi:hypothetical protein